MTGDPCKRKKAVNSVNENQVKETYTILFEIHASYWYCICSGFLRQVVSHKRLYLAIVKRKERIEVDSLACTDWSVYRVLIYAT